MLVPGLAFDAAGGRLGHGGGYYDAAGRRWREAARAGVLVGLAFDFQVVDRRPVDERDVAVDFVVTDRRTIAAGDGGARLTLVGRRGGAGGRRLRDRALRQAGAVLCVALPQSDAEKQRLLEAAKAEAESLKRQAVLDAKELAQKRRARRRHGADLKARQGLEKSAAAELGERERELDKRDRADGAAERRGRARDQAARGARGGRRGGGARGGAAGHGRRARGPSASPGSPRSRPRPSWSPRCATRRAFAWPTRSRRFEDAARVEADEKSKMIIGVVQRYARVRRRAHRRDGAAALRRHEGQDHRARGPQHPSARGGHASTSPRRHARGGGDLVLQSRAIARPALTRASSPTDASTRRASRRWSRRPRRRSRRSARRRASRRPSTRLAG